ncbi:Por secretion system C-terminal sorting domain-containing protein [Chitinophaga costaii]|uniref:Por secretion system C-terminal sorting domain-containing protein n=1 Tax=Chitinophaga costaii TaxID=1335309 RepID=A0A1C4DXR5_9BACT|nr:T9SS type A sorting domain-containing protein [Chitinophaga costaii]PUZ27859.1 T9SS C-terminal target domain-containing protein [Chitinophaga costaii]SCC36196.1 Por secretion system C-terminal sorting domain-containing protein [Chitinophaga costaii]
MHRFVVLFWLLISLRLAAQPVPIGHWRSHLPASPTLALAFLDGELYCATPYTVFSVSSDEHAFTTYSKINGLHDAGISCMNANASALVIAYRNGNLDILKDKQFYNLPDVLQKNIAGDKSIHSISFYNETALLASGLGIIVVNLDRLEITDTYVIGDTGNYLSVIASATNAGYLYAATATGVKRAPLQGVNLADYHNWASSNDGLQPGPVAEIIEVNNQLIARQGDTLYQWNNARWQPWYTAPGNHISHIRASNQQVLVCETPGRIITLNTAGTLLSATSNNINAPADALLQDNTLWIADSTAGLVWYHDGQSENLSPNAPQGIATGDLIFNHDTLWAMAGSVTSQWAPTGNHSGFYRFANDTWSTFQPGLDTLPDLITATVLHDTLYAGSFGGGLLQMSPDGHFTVYKKNALLPPSENNGAYNVSGLTSDAAGNLWISAYGAATDVVVKKASGQWLTFSIPYYHAQNAVSQVLVDDYNQKWIVSPQQNGLFVLNTGATLDNAADDKWLQYSTGANSGNLPSNDVRCLAKDKNGWIWIGTAQGIAVIACGQEVFGAGCPAYLPIVQEGNFAGYLFQQEQINAIAIDGANRKWVATNNGVWLVAEGGDTVLQHFDESNSPLLSNIVYKIAIDPLSGEVFFATDNGIISYRGTATETSNVIASSVLAFPNPVPPGYTGIIAVRGLFANATVKITDISGKLVYETKASGGQATWNGQDYTGHRPQSGVYLVFASNANGSEHLVTKIIFIH